MKNVHGEIVIGTRGKLYNAFYSNCENSCQCFTDIHSHLKLSIRHIETELKYTIFEQLETYGV